MRFQEKGGKVVVKPMPDEHGLRAVAPAGLHKGSMRRCLLWLLIPGLDVARSSGQFAGQCEAREQALVVALYAAVRPWCDPPVLRAAAVR
jgi:hypothetical protein